VRAPTRVLIVEDEPAIADALRYGLEREGFACSVSADGLDALSRFRSEQPQLVLLDLMLPGVPGLDICRAIRETSKVPIIILSARDSETEKVLGLELGADDYITKPFSPRELLARVRTVLRRAEAKDVPGEETTLRSGPVEIDLERHEARIDGAPIMLPPKEFLLLEYLVRRAGKLCTRDTLLATVWGPDYFGDTRTLDVHVKRLRAKIEPNRRTPKHLKTVYGLGYKFEP
jgi:two-component system response regulator RegX3